MGWSRFMWGTDEVRAVAGSALCHRSIGYLQGILFMGGQPRLAGVCDGVALLWASWSVGD